MKDQPYFCILELSDEGYYHGHQMINTDKVTSLWLSYTYKVKDILSKTSGYDPSETRLPNCSAHYCSAPKHVSATEIMTNYVTFSTKGKNIGSGDLRLDPLGPEPIRPILDKPTLLTDDPTAAWINRHWDTYNEWKAYELRLHHWRDLKYKLDMAKRYKREWSFILSEPKHPHHAFHKATLARKEQFVADLITRETTQ